MNVYMFALMLATVFSFGWFFGAEIWTERRAKKDVICPVCLSVTNEEGVYDHE